MRRQVADAIAPPLYGSVNFLVILAPALSVKIASDRGGLGDTDGLDLLAASTVLGTTHAVVAASRLRAEERTAVRRADMWIASIDALVVLTFAATILPLVVLWGFADEHASLAHRGYPVVALWRVCRGWPSSSPKPPAGSCSGGSNPTPAAPSGSAATSWAFDRRGGIGSVRAGCVTS